MSIVAIQPQVKTAIKKLRLRLVSIDMINMEQIAKITLTTIRCLTLVKKIKLNMDKTINKMPQNQGLRRKPLMAIPLFCREICIGKINT